MDELKFNFEQNLKTRRILMGPRNRKKTKTFKPINWQYPLAQEMQYGKNIKKWLYYPTKPITKVFREVLPEIVKEAKIDELAHKLDAAGRYSFNESVNLIHKAMGESKMILDAWYDELRKYIDQLKGNIPIIFGAEGSDPERSDIWTLLLVATGLSVLRSNRKQWEKQTNQVLGFSYQVDESWWPAVYTPWSQDNYELLKGLNNEYVKKINTIVLNGVRDGLTTNEISKEISRIDQQMFTGTIDPKTGKKKRSRADLIARDQIGKLNGQITKRRMQEIGQDLYIWRTSQDERVRGNPAGKYPKAIPSHFIMDGKICKWSDNTVYAEESDIEKDKDGNIIKINWKPRTASMPIADPGQEILCRCVALPYWPITISDIDLSLEG